MEELVIITRDQLEHIVRRCVREEARRPAEPVSQEVDSPRFITLQRAADQYEISRSTLYRARRAGDLDSISVKGKVYLEVRAIEAWIESHRL